MLTRSRAETSEARRSYGFLVDRLLPTHLLEPARRDGLASALASANPEHLYRETVAACLDLEAAGLFEELPAAELGARLFRRRPNGDRVLLSKPRRVAQQASRPISAAIPDTLAEPASPSKARDASGLGSMASSSGSWEPAPLDLGAALEVLDEPAAAAVAPPQDSESSLGLDTGLGPEPAAPPARPTAAGATAAAAAPAPEIHSAPPVPVEGLGALESLLDLAAIESQLEPFGDRLRRIVAQLEAALPGARARLLCLDAEGSEGLGDGGVEILDRAAADEVPHYREALRLGETQFATSAPVGADPSTGRVAAAVPIYVGGEPWGLLRVTWEQGSVESVPDLARLLAPIARLVATAIQNQTVLEKLVFVDPLTSVYNRAFYDRQVMLEIERANRTNQKFGLLVMDIDDFKPINDRWGHRAGDQVLSQLGREVRARMRKIDLMFRYGGEEFVLLLPGADLEEAQRTAERLRTVVLEQRFLPEGVPQPLRVTVSIGGAIYPDQSRTKTGIFNAADTALYRAKHEGKNRVAF